jgi:hypothetical protein
MSPVARLCSRHGVIVVYGETCPDCLWDPPHTRRDPGYRALMDSHRWKKVRAAARRRDGGCVRRDEGGCYGRLEVHHVVRPRHGGDPYALSNLRTVCRGHHTQEERRR